MRIKITSNGTTTGTQVTNAETGEAIENVRALTISADADTSEFRVFLELDTGAGKDLDLDLEADAEISG